MAFAARAGALGGQAQEEAADEPTGQDDVPLYKVCGLCEKGRKRWRMRWRTLKTNNSDNEHMNL